MERIMCPPRYFDIEYSINPWMNVSNKVNRSLAFKQWYRLIDILEGLGDVIHIVDAVPGLPDMTFCGDAGLVWNKIFIPSNFRHKERKGEVRNFIRWFEKNGYHIYTMPGDLAFEGLGDVVIHEDVAFFGHGPRTDKGALEYLSERIPDLKILGKMEIADDRHFHLALALSFVNRDTVLYYPPAFTEESVENLKKAIEKTISVSREDATEYFACNNVVVGNKVIVYNFTPRLRAELAEHGYEIVTCDMSEFKKSGGSVRCLVLDLT